MSEQASTQGSAPEDGAIADSAIADSATADSATADSATADSATADESAKPKIDWADPDIPPGDSPPMPRKGLIISALAFCLWFVFLIVMACIRIGTTPY